MIGQVLVMHYAEKTTFSHIYHHHSITGLLCSNPVSRTMFISLEYKYL